jgi:hypothetical protein
MTYWLGLGGVLLIGYALIKWSGRANEQANEGDSGVHNTATAGKLGLRSPATVNAQTNTNNNSENQGDNGGEA